MADYVAALDQGTTSTRCILFDHAGEGVTVQDRSGRLVYANDEAARLVGVGQKERDGECTRDGRTREYVADRSKLRPGAVPPRAACRTCE